MVFASNTSKGGSAPLQTNARTLRHVEEHAGARAARQRFAELQARDSEVRKELAAVRAEIGQQSDKGIIARVAELLRGEPREAGPSAEERERNLRNELAAIEQACRKQTAEIEAQRRAASEEIVGAALPEYRAEERKAWRSSRMNRSRSLEESTPIPE
jgi:hypothetical protein